VKLLKKTIELISPHNYQFKGTDAWLQCFIERNNLSLRKPNEKSTIQIEQFKIISEKFKRHVKETIQKYNINPNFIINFDETPFFWSYLPRKIVTPKLSKAASSWKRGYQKSRSTLCLSITASGELLRPLLILKRLQPYILQCKNDIDLIISNTQNGWANESIIIEWIDRVLLPFVGKNHCMLLYDSFESHISDKVLLHLSKYPNIHVGIIVGGTTSTDQPLDLKINKSFKDLCRRESVAFTNSMLKESMKLDHSILPLKLS